MSTKIKLYLNHVEKKEIFELIDYLNSYKLGNLTYELEACGDFFIDEDYMSFDPLKNFNRDPASQVKLNSCDEDFVKSNYISFDPLKEWGREPTPQVKLNSYYESCYLLVCSDLSLRNAENFILRLKEKCSSIYKYDIEIDACNCLRKVDKKI